MTEPVYHLAVAADWSAGGQYPWSTRGVSYDAEGYVHCSFAGQLAGIRTRYYADLADEELLVLELDLDRARGPDRRRGPRFGAAVPAPVRTPEPALVRGVAPYGR